MPWRRIVSRLVRGGRDGPISRVQRIVMPQSTPHPTHGYLVGGAVRDVLLGRGSRDLDWLVEDPAAEAERAVARLRAADRSHAAAFVMDSDRGHWRVVAGDDTLDYAPLRCRLEDDLKQRDFSLNAIAAGLDGTLIDPAGGRADLDARRLRMTSFEALAADPIRPLRGVRLATELGFTLEPATRAAMSSLALAQAAGGPMPAWERVGVELERVLMAEAAARGFGLADELGMLEPFLPELAACRAVEQGGFHHLDVLAHEIEALRRLLVRFPLADAALRWAVLLHDIGKPRTRALMQDGRVHFYGHAKLGQALTRNALGRLRLPHAMADRAGLLVRYHMLPLPADERSARRFVHRRRALLPGLLQLMLADREAARGPLASEGSRTAYRVALSRVLAVLEQTPPSPPLLDGRDVMTLLGIPPGARIGEALRLLAEAEAVGDATTPEEARALLLTYANAQGWTAHDVSEDTR